MESPLHSAVALADRSVGSDIQLEIVKLLLDNGADINSKGSYGYTPLHAAVAANNDDD
jgi:ankyrin repeat protein